MLRASLLFLSVASVFLGLLTVVKSPDWSPWRLAVLAGEYGHWLATIPLCIIALAWVFRGHQPVLAAATTVVCGLAVVLLFRPCYSAARIGRDLPAQLERQLGPIPLARAPFSVGGLFARGPSLGPVETISVGTELVDFYRSSRPDSRAAPCVIVVHGGGWDSGDRKQLIPFNHWLVERGYAVAAVSYRLAPKFIWPAQRDDVLAAIRYLKSHAGELGIDPDRLVLLGRSAGGQIAEVVGYAARDPAVRGVVGLYSPSDLNFGYAHAREDDVLKSPALMRKYLGGPPETTRANYDSASALSYVTPATPPTLLLHGELDALVWHRHSVRLEARLAEQGVARAFVSLPWASHAFEVNLHGPGGQLTTYAVEWFLAAVTK